MLFCPQRAPTDPFLDAHLAPRLGRPPPAPPLNRNPTKQAMGPLTPHQTLLLPPKPPENAETDVWEAYQPQQEARRRVLVAPTATLPGGGSCREYRVGPYQLVCDAAPGGAPSARPSRRRLVPWRKPTEYGKLWVHCRLSHRHRPRRAMVHLPLPSPAPPRSLQLPRRMARGKSIFSTLST